MKNKFFTVALLGLIGLGAVVAAENKTSRPNIYDESADGQKQLATALSTAKQEKKRVLLQFGANWCGWCHKLHKLFNNDTAIKERLAANYVVVLIDVNKGHNKELIEKYRAERLGLPSIAILDADGKHLTTKNTAELEEGDHHSPEKVMAFLKDWASSK